MQQRPIPAYLALKKLSTREVHDNPKAVLGSDALTYSSAMCCLRAPRFPPSITDAASVDVPHGINDFDQAIISALEDSSFASVRQLSRLTHLPFTTVDRHFIEPPGFSTRHL
jgi:hypothetical protein